MSGISVDNGLWKGVRISQLPKSLDHPQFPDLISHEKHTVLIEIPVVGGRVPKSYPTVNARQDYWDSDHVKLPCSEMNLTPERRKRWDMIKETLTGPRIQSAQQLEAVILSYNTQYSKIWKFTMLKSFFQEVTTVEERTMFFESLLPKIIDLALSLPELITQGIPLLKRNRTHSISLSQQQIACLLANSFLCTFPCRNEGKKSIEYGEYPAINFNELFHCEKKHNVEAVLQKIQCLLHYFKRITDSVPTGVVTFGRNYISSDSFPKWPNSNKTLSRLYVSSKGNIEDDGYGFFQMDFADKFIGGLVTTTGCVQEEIRFVICPELIVSRLFTQCIGENEAVIITGCERFSNYKGYGARFTWSGDHIDQTPRDEYGRRYCTVLALDALNCRWKPNSQYLPKNITREINKAYAGFSWGCDSAKKDELCAVATGNWGCGIFRGNVQLKSLLQIMAASEAGRDLAYFSFGNVKLQDSMAITHQLLVDNGVTIGKLYQFILEYADGELLKSVNVFEFLQNRLGVASSSKIESNQPRTIDEVCTRKLPSKEDSFSKRSSA